MQSCIRSRDVTCVMIILKKSLRDAYHFGLTPAGLFGAHHFYLGRKLFGIFYMTTAGVLGIGWIVDWIRMHFLVERANNPERNSNGSRLAVEHLYLVDSTV
jgi:TM2 domain